MVSLIGSVMQGAPRATGMLRAGVVAVAMVCFGAGRVTAEVDGVAAGDGALFCPIDLEVVDAEATAAIALKAGEAPPVVIVFDPAVATSVTAAFADGFSRTREAFLEGMQIELGTRKLDGAAINDVAFRDFRTRFQADNALFPVSPILGQTWARGIEGDTVRDRIGSLLRVLERDRLIGDVRAASTVFVVSADFATRVKSWGEVVVHARTVGRAEILSIGDAGEQLRRMNDPLDRAASGFLSGLLRANVTEDAYLTGLLFYDRMGSATVHRSFVRGERLVEAGQNPDRWATLALEALGRQGTEPLSEPIALPVAQTETGVVATVSVRSSAWIWWVAGGVSVVAIFAGWVAMAIRTRRSVGALQLVPGASGHAGIGEALIPHFAKELKDRLIRALFTQRSVLLANEQAASRRVQEMEERLARLQPAIAEKIRGYEQRIEALEKEISERDVETRDLIRAKLVLARKELEAEITRNRIDWN